MQFDETCIIAFQVECFLCFTNKQLLLTVFFRISELNQAKVVFVYITFPHYYLFYSKNGKKFLKHCDDAHEISDAFIRKRREEMVKGTLDENRKLDFLDTLLQAKVSNADNTLLFLD